MKNSKEKRPEYTPEWIAKDRKLSEDEVRLIGNLIEMAIDDRDGAKGFPTAEARFMKQLFTIDD